MNFIFNLNTCFCIYICMFVHNCTCKLYTNHWQLLILYSLVELKRSFWCCNKQRFLLIVDRKYNEIKIQGARDGICKVGHIISKTICFMNYESFFAPHESVYKIYSRKTCGKIRHSATSNTCETHASLHKGKTNTTSPSANAVIECRIFKLVTQNWQEFTTKYKKILLWPFLI